MSEPAARPARDRPLTSPLFLMGVALSLGACGGLRPTAVSPEEIPELESRLAEEPGNADLTLRYAAALFSAGQCDTARAVALNGSAMKPRSALAPLVIGQCFERDGEYDQAVAVYRRYLATHADQRGAPAVRAREMLAVRSRANQRARTALLREAALARQPTDPQTIAVLPLDIVGDSSYQPLSRGLAQMLTSDLALLQRFRLVERLQVNALLNEMRLAEVGQVDLATAARVGRLLQAGRMVQGLATIPPEGEVRLEASVVRATGEVTAPEASAGRLRDLLQMEKEIVVGIANQLGYVLSQAERRMILENGTQNLTAFLAYSRGLLAEDLGDYSAAAAHFADAVRADPGFSQAREQYQANAAASDVQQATAGEVTTVANETVPEPDAVGEQIADAVSSTVGDLAATQSEQTSVTGTTQTTQQAGETSAAQPPPTTTAQGTSTTATGTIRIVFRLP